MARNYQNKQASASLRLSMTSSFNKWIPFCGANTKEKISELALTGVSDTYVWRASYLPALNVDSQFVCDEKQNFDVLRFGLNEWKSIRNYLLAEFYPLTPWHSEKDTSSFTATCYFDPDKSEGIILAFRQEKCENERLTVTLPFITDGELYAITDEDSKEQSTTNGTLNIKFSAPRTAKLLRLHKI